MRLKNMKFNTICKLSCGLIVVIMLYGVGMIPMLPMIKIQSQSLCSSNIPIQSITLSLDGKFVLATWNHGQARMWNIKTGQVVQTFVQDSYPNEIILNATISSNNKYVLTASQIQAILWDAISGRKLQTFSVNTLNPFAIPLAFFPNNKDIL